MFRNLSREKETQSYRILQMAWLFNAFKWHINRCLFSVPVIKKESFEYFLHKRQYMAWFYSIKGEKLRSFILEWQNQIIYGYF